jgi:hypothetical protein
VVCLEEKRRNTYRVLLGKPEGRRALGQPFHRWEGIEVDHKKRAWLMLLRMGTGGGCFEHCNEASVLKNVVNFLTS